VVAARSRTIFREDGTVSAVHELPPAVHAATYRRPEPETEPEPELPPGRFFASRYALHHALEEYATFQDNAGVRRYAPRTSGRTGPASGQELNETQFRILEQNQHIDRAMRRLYLVSPALWRLLHCYYRRPGPSGTPAACQEARGWLHASYGAEWSTEGTGPWGAGHFEKAIDAGVDVLWFLHARV
jgi:hypothetical protein